MYSFNYSQFLGMVLLLLSYRTFGQDEAAIYRDAADFMWRGNYDMALEAIEYLPQSPDVDYMRAICILLSDRIKNQPVEKYLAFEKFRAKDPLYYYWLGMIYLKRMNQIEAKRSFEKYLAADNPRSSLAMAHHNEVTNIITYLNQQPDNYKIVPLESPLNSNYAEIRGALFDNQKRLIFASDRTSAGLFTVYTASKGPYGWDSPEALSAVSATTKEFLNILQSENSFYFFDPAKSELFSIDLTSGGWGEKLRWRSTC